MPNPVNGNFHLINITTGEDMRSGDVIKARVKAVLPNGRFRLYCRGRMLTAKSSLKLFPGQVIRGEVEQKGSSFFLRLLDSSGKPGKTLSGEVPGKLLSAALLRAGLSLADETESMRRTALLKRTRGTKLRMARLYAELLAKGTDPSASFLETLDSIFSRRKTRHNLKRWIHPPTGDELKNELTDNSSSATQRTANSDILLNLLNSVPGKRENWLFRCLERELEEGNLRMVWKIRKGMKPALALSVYDGNRSFEFLMEGLEKMRLAVHTDEKTEIDEKLWESFRKRLSLINVEVGDTLLPISKSDGFTSGSDKVMQNLGGW